MVYTTLATDVIRDRSRNEGESHSILERTDSIQNFFIVAKNDLAIENKNKYNKYSKSNK